MAINLEKAPFETFYYYAENGKTVGPFPLKELLPKITADTLVYREGIEWTNAKDVEELKAHFPEPEKKPKNPSKLILVLILFFVLLGASALFYFFIVDGSKKGSISTLNCSSTTNSGTLTQGIVATEVSSTVPYAGGNGGELSEQIVNSTGVPGLVATVSDGTFANGSGYLTFTITGSPAGSGTANFALNIGGQTCTLTWVVNPVGVASEPTSNFAITGSPNTVDEGTSATFTISTTNVEGGPNLYWTTDSPEGVENTPSSYDFKDGLTQGRITINGNRTTLVRPLLNDNLTEGKFYEVFVINLREGSFSGKIVATSNVISIRDTSKNEPKPEYFKCLRGEVREVLKTSVNDGECDCDDCSDESNI